MFSTLLNFTDIYNEFDENTSDLVIKRLMEVTKFSNAKMGDKIAQYRLDNYEAVNQLQDYRNFEMVEQLTWDYMNNQYSNGSYSFIINLDKNSDRNGIYKVKSGDAIKVKFSGILEFITPKAFEAISNKYMHTFDKLKKKFISKKLDTLKEKVQKSQKSNGKEAEWYL